MASKADGATRAIRSEGPRSGSIGGRIDGIWAEPELDRCAGEIRQVLPDDGLGVRFFLADAAGRLRCVHRTGRVPDPGRRQSVARRETLRDNVTRFLPTPDGRLVAIFAIDRRGRSIGVAEVSAPRNRMLRHRRSIERSVGGLSERLHKLLEHARRRRELDLGLAWTAHELRGPLVAARLWLEHAAGAVGLRASEPITKAVEELARLSQGVESILRLAVGSETFHVQEVDLADLVHDAAAVCVAESGDDRVVIEGADRLPVEVDPLHLRSAIENLIRNALRYSSPGTKVRVLVERRGADACVEVENEGPGIPSTDRDGMFEPLARGAEGGGTGLGLFVVRRIVDGHGGTVRCHEPDEGRVSFELTLPSRPRG